MGGLGGSFRYRPLPMVGLDVGVDLFAGRDFIGDSRREAVLSGSSLLYFNSRDPVQSYLLAGVSVARAYVDHQREGRRGRSEYAYFGGQLGLGLEWHLRERLAVSLDLLGFLRGRTDSGADQDPEFIRAETGVTTNTSGGGLLRVGTTFYF